MRGTSALQEIKIMSSFSVKTLALTIKHNTMRCVITGETPVKTGNTQSICPQPDCTDRVCVCGRVTGVVCGADVAEGSVLAFDHGVADQ